MNRLKEECAKCRWFMDDSGSDDTCAINQDPSDNSRCQSYRTERRKGTTVRGDRRERKE